jgi:hypothetical protein
VELDGWSELKVVPAPTTRTRTTLTTPLAQTVQTVQPAQPAPQLQLQFGGIEWGNQDAATLELHRVERLQKEQGARLFASRCVCSLKMLFGGTPFAGRVFSTANPNLTLTLTSEPLQANHFKRNNCFARISLVELYVLHSK